MYFLLKRGRPIFSRFFTTKDHQIGSWKSQVKRLRRQIVQEDTSTQRRITLQGSQKVVAMAICSNMIMFTGKMYGAVTSGSASMFAESLHSLADMLNESLLMWGIWRSLRKPDDDHPYGFISEKYAWALVSGCGVFFLGGGVSLYHGITGIMAGGQVLGDLFPTVLALSGSLVFESITLFVAYKHISKSATLAGVSFSEYLKSSADPSAVQVFLEDCASIMGIAIAGSCIMLSKLLHMPFIDSIGSISIGLLLSSVAMFLIRRNISSLTEAALDPTRENEIVKLLESDPIVRSVHDIKSTSLGPEWARFKAEIHFNGEAVTKRLIEKDPIAFQRELAKLKSMETNQEMEEWMIKNGSKVVSALGTEVDRLEVEIKKIRPEVKHIDLEIL